jgi:alpha-L-arabinofuranosidase
MNLAAWFDVDTYANDINTAFANIGIKALRWPGGSWSDSYHWGMNGVPAYMCQTQSPVTGGWGGYSDDTLAQFLTSIVKAGSYDLALTANYGSNEACTGGGDPAEAAAWVKAALSDGITVSHMTVGNEEFGSWENDLHSIQHDPSTYVAAVTGSNGYYNQIKAASSNTLAGVVVDANCTTANGCTDNWDSTVLANAKGYYDFVEYHYYPQDPGHESDTFLVQQAAQIFTQNINTIKQELSTVGKPNTPIYVGEVSSGSSNPGKQSLSITQGLYAGQILGEMMNDGISRTTWWIGFGNCNGTSGNAGSSLYGWQDFGAYNVFSDGTLDSTCSPYGSIGSMSPTARAFQLFSSVAVNGEHVLTPSIVGDTTDVRAYAATHSGGMALILFNLNQTTSEPITVSLTGKTTSSDVQVTTYNKAIYDLTQNNVWDAPTTTDLGAQSLPLSLTLTPWSMNLVILQ